MSCFEDRDVGLGHARVSSLDPIAATDPADFAAPGRTSVRSSDQTLVDTELRGELLRRGSNHKQVIW
jgi:hypothetical protein